MMFHFEQSFWGFFTVQLPPSKNETETARVLNLDQDDKKEKFGDKNDGLKTESRLNIEVSENLKLKSWILDTFILLKQKSKPLSK